MRVLIALLFILHASVSFATDVPSAPLTEEEKTKHEQIIANAGKMSSENYIIGGLAGTFVGFGLGHSIQGRWEERGWVFTAGEGAGVVLLLVALTDCLSDGDSKWPNGCGEKPAAAGLITLLAFHMWEVFDVWGTPLINDQVAFNIAPPEERKPGMFIVSYRF